MLRFQVGYGDIHIVIPCGKCGCELRGKCIHNQENISLEFSFDNAELVEPCQAEFVAQYSRELLAKKVEPFSYKSMLSPSPFMGMSKYFLMDSDTSTRLKGALSFVETSLPQLGHIFDLVTLWENEKIAILAQQLNRLIPDCPMEAPNRLQVFMRLHHTFIKYLSPLLPINWFNDLDIFSLMGDMLRRSKDNAGH